MSLGPLIQKNRRGGHAEDEMPENEMWCEASSTCKEWLCKRERGLELNIVWLKVDQDVLKFLR